MSETMDDAIARVPHMFKLTSTTSMTSQTVGVHADDCPACALARARAEEKEQVERLDLLLAAAIEAGIEYEKIRYTPFPSSQTGPLRPTPDSVRQAWRERQGKKGGANADKSKVL